MTKNCLDYVQATAKIYFETDKVCCRYCPLLTESPRYECRATGTYLTDINVVGMWCPLAFEKSK